jgi:hypothetical protein
LFKELSLIATGYSTGFSATSWSAGETARYQNSSDFLDLARGLIAR